jgi:hypothetical protein
VFCRRFEQSAVQVSVPMHGPAQYDFSGEDFIKEDVPFEGTKNQKESPGPQIRMLKTPWRPEIRLLGQQPAHGLDRIEIAIGHLPTCV